MDIRTKDLIRCLHRMIRTDGNLCIGCGYEHGCMTRGCAILRRAVEALTLMPYSPWTNMADGVPDSNGNYLCRIVMMDSYGRVRNEPSLLCVLRWDTEAKTYFDTGLNWAIVSHWMPIPDPPEE